MMHGWLSLQPDSRLSQQDVDCKAKYVLLSSCLVYMPLGESPAIGQANNMYPKFC